MAFNKKFNSKSLVQVGTLRMIIAAVFTMVPAPQVTAIVWCLKGSAELPYCNNMTTIFETLAPTLNISCYVSTSEDACITALSTGVADVVSVDGGDIYSAYVNYGVKMVAQEQNAVGGTEYWGVAVARASECGSGTKLSDFKGKNTCHTGYRRASGWLLPVWAMVVNSTLVQKVNLNASVNNDIETVEAYFDKVCAPGDATNGQVCTLCPSACDADTSPYSDYDGALNCMMNGGGDLAFTKNGIAEQYASDGVNNQTWSNLKGSEMMLLCPQGGCQELSAYATCNYGFVKGHAIIARKEITASQITALNTLFIAANSDATFVDLFLSGNNVNAYIFKSDTTRLSNVSGLTPQEYLGDEYSVYSTVEALDTSVPFGTSAASTGHATLGMLFFGIIATIALW